MHHGALVRLSLNLDEDLYLAAKSLAMAEGCSISAAVNTLLRRQNEPKQRPKSRSKRFPVVRGKRRFTSEEVYRIEQM
jgi:hypothetical protein